MDGSLRLITQRTVVNIFADLHELTLKPKACKRASAFLAQVTTVQDGFRIAHTLKEQNKFVLRGYDSAI